MNSLGRAKLAAKPVPTPGCRATPTESNGWGTIYRGADHMRCAHPTPTPPGFHRCQGHWGCNFRLPDGGPKVCYYHRDADPGPGREYAEWGGPQPLTGNWSTR